MDAKFIYHTKADFEVGSELVVNGKDLSIGANAVIAAALTNLKLVDDWFAENRPELRKNVW